MSNTKKDSSAAKGRDLPDPDEVLRRMLNTPPKPHKEQEPKRADKKNKRKKT